ncbi:spermine/spermidine synthase domain-containing protein [Thermotalea metallivorans]|uniref:Spermidine synthase n=1 Tax=Thermotalea metallivorans TaxID=520762 RepID=A0A140KZM7_9FIRM|nr:hypothetical protein [Thermotalea metallivorans]KXG73752.1 hypothetical protein AN619_29170 [Thermotalea metallivorans]
MVEINVQKKSRVCLYSSMFFMGLSLLLYEVILTRLFSVILTFNLVFFVVSFSILGSGMGGIWVYKVLKENKGRSAKEILIKFAMWMPISILWAIGLIYFLPFLPIFTIYAIIGAVPFCLGGIIISCIFQEKENKSSKLYLMDLMGSAIGSLAAIPLMNRLGFMGSVVVISILSLLASMLIYQYFKETKRLMAMGIGLLMLVSGLIQGDVIKGIEKNFNAYYSNSTKIIGYLKKTDEKPLGISFTKWDAISRTDVIETTNRNEKIIVTDGGGAAPIIKFNGDLKSVQYLKKDVNYIPFSFGKNETALVIGSGGGKDVLFALLGGTEEIHAVEINTSTIEAVNYFKDFNGDIYHRPGVEVHNQDGRNFIENSKERYDNIYLSMVMTNAIENTAYSLSENYIYTYEAFQKYFEHLSEKGKLSFMMHSSLDLTRIVNTGIKVLLDQGIPQEQVTDYFVIINGADKRHQNMHREEISMPLVIFKKQPFTKEEINTIKAEVTKQNRAMIHYPGGEDGLYQLIKEKKMNFEELVKTIPFNAAPITDSKPFFYRYTKFFPTEILYVFLGGLLVWLGIHKKYLTRLENKKTSTYFMGLGVAFMLVEIPMIQKMNLYFGNPSMTFSVVLFSILVSCGIGSGFSGTRIGRKFTAHSSAYLLSIAIMITITQLNMDNMMEMTNHLGFMKKTWIGFIMIFPMGLLMGVAFPTGLQKLKEIYHDKDMIPFMWGINGIFSVIGSTLAIMVSMKFGFDAAIYTGAGIYLLLYLFNPLKNGRCGKHI